MLAYFSLFAIAFFAATLLPLSSDVLFGALLAPEYSLTALLFWGTLGTTLGACVHWWLGTLLRNNYTRLAHYRRARIKG